MVISVTVFSIFVGLGLGFGFSDVRQSSQILAAAQGLGVITLDI